MDNNTTTKTATKRRITDSKEELLRQFREQCQKLGSTAQRKYETQRSKGQPCVKTLLRKFNITTWNELLELAGLKINGYPSSGTMERQLQKQKLSLTRIRKEPSDELIKIINQFVENAMKSNGK